MAGVDIKKDYLQMQVENGFLNVEIFKAEKQAELKRMLESGQKLPDDISCGKYNNGSAEEVFFYRAEKPTMDPQERMEYLSLKQTKALNEIGVRQKTILNSLNSQLEKQDKILKWVTLFGILTIAGIAIALVYVIFMLSKACS